MKKFILAIIVTIAAVFPVASSADNDSIMMNWIVKILNEEKDPKFSAAWEAPYLIMNFKIDKIEDEEDRAAVVLNLLLAHGETAPMVKDAMMEEFLNDPEMLELFMALEEVGLKGIRLNITDSLGAKATLLITMDDIRTYKASKEAEPVTE